MNLNYISCANGKNTFSNWNLIATYDPGWNDPPPMPTGPPTSSVSTKPRLTLNKRVAFPVQSGTAQTSQNVKTTTEGLPLPFSTAKYDPRIFNPVPNTNQTQLPPPPSMPLLPPPASTLPSTATPLPSAAAALPETTLAMPAPASDLIQTVSAVPEADSELLLPVSTLPSVDSALPTSSPSLSQLPPPSSAAPPTILAPPLSLTSQIPVANADTSAEPAETSAFDSEEAREYCRMVFDRLLVTPKIPTDLQKIADIRKRLDILHHMWSEKMFDETMQKVIHQLAIGRSTLNLLTEAKIYVEVIFIQFFLLKISFSSNFQLKKF